MLAPGGEQGRAELPLRISTRPQVSCSRSPSRCHVGPACGSSSSLRDSRSASSAQLCIIRWALNSGLSHWPMPSPPIEKLASSVTLTKRTHLDPFPGPSSSHALPKNEHVLMPSGRWPTSHSSKCSACGGAAEHEKALWTHSLCLTST